MKTPLVLVLVLVLAIGAGWCPARAEETVVDCTKSVNITTWGNNCCLMEAVYNLTAEDFRALNPGLICKRLRKSDQVCVAGTPAPPANGTVVVCTKEIALAKRMRCKTVRQNWNVPIKKFAALNPNLPCDAKMRLGTKVCVKGDVVSADSVVPIVYPRRLAAEERSEQCTALASSTCRATVNDANCAVCRPDFAGCFACKDGYIRRGGICKVPRRRRR